MASKAEIVLGVIGGFTSGFVHRSVSRTAPVTPEMTLHDDLEFDSLDMIEIMLEVEEAFDIQITDDEIVRLTTVQSLIDIVEHKSAGIPT